MTHDDLLEAVQRNHMAASKEDKAKLRKKLEAEMEAFFANGGTIKEVEPGDGRGIPCRF